MIGFVSHQACSAEQIISMLERNPPCLQACLQQVHRLYKSYSYDVYASAWKYSSNDILLPNSKLSYAWAAELSLRIVQTTTSIQVLIGFVSHETFIAEQNIALQERNPPSLQAIFHEVYAIACKSLSDSKQIAQRNNLTQCRFNCETSPTSLNIDSFWVQMTNLRQITIVLTCERQSCHSTLYRLQYQ